jgi:hypothetical protein
MDWTSGSAHSSPRLRRFMLLVAAGFLVSGEARAWELGEEHRIAEESPDTAQVESAVAQDQAQQKKAELEALQAELRAITTPEKLKAWCAQLKREKRLSGLLELSEKGGSLSGSTCMLGRAARQWLKQGKGHFLAMLAALPDGSSNYYRMRAFEDCAEMCLDDPELFLAALDRLSPESEDHILSGIIADRDMRNAPLENSLLAIITRMGRGSSRTRWMQSFFSQQTLYRPIMALDQLSTLTDARDRELASLSWLECLDFCMFPPADGSVGGWTGLDEKKENLKMLRHDIKAKSRQVEVVRASLKSQGKEELFWRFEKLVLKP